MSVMYCAGNGTERMRARHFELRSDPEIVVDMFAGIGYFTLPLAIRDSRVRVIAIEKVIDFSLSFALTFIRDNISFIHINHFPHFCFFS
jgi:tRNA wybutosine-synthesizing protein 2